MLARVIHLPNDVGLTAIPVMTLQEHLHKGRSRVNEGGLEGGARSTEEGKSEVVNQESQMCMPRKGKRRILDLTK